MHLQPPKLGAGSYVGIFAVEISLCIYYTGISVEFHTYSRSQNYARTEY